ncbi:hypothetical protein BJF77_14080 [Kocuria sp. CNJ-770]|uniref:DUF6668 family protein n=1 Tax=Kocuria sp. CNJ-770 TaxID=1904964 RepID=UPI00095CD2F2|nr:DUF6668 family protein [Kocuria sp. CNJ-770]OLT07520.1 hypothetical protein BJF77_14080 [Kocuria sp. CNJ-770]
MITNQDKDTQAGRQDQDTAAPSAATLDRPVRPVAPGGGNPFVLPPEEEEAGPEPIDTDPVLGTAASLLGRTGVEDTGSGKGLWLIGAAGGVGVSTLAAACGAHVYDGADSEPPWSARAAVVTSCTRTALDATQELVQASHAGIVPWEAVAVVIVHDRPAELVSKDCRRRARAVLRMVKGGGYTIPFLPELRESAAPALDLGVTRSRKVIEALDKLATRTSSPRKEK